jgi:hypothetical protein
VELRGGGGQMMMLKVVWQRGVCVGAEMVGLCAAKVQAERAARAAEGSWAKACRSRGISGGVMVLREEALAARAGGCSARVGGGRR